MMFICELLTNLQWIYYDAKAKDLVRKKYQASKTLAKKFPRNFFKSFFIKNIWWQKLPLISRSLTIFITFLFTWATHQHKKEIYINLCGKNFYKSFLFKSRYLSPPYFFQWVNKLKYTNTEQLLKQFN